MARVPVVVPLAVLVLWGAAAFPQVGVASIGALAVARSNPNVIYGGTGEETRGNGRPWCTSARPPG